MHLLVLGGTVFLGRHIVAAALKGGHQVTTFNRGNHKLAEQADVERLTGDRDGDLSALAGRKFDAVIDTCGYKPEQVRATVEALTDSVGTYVFISSISVYKNFRTLPLDESTPVSARAPGSEGDYGSLKAECENVVQSLMSERFLVVRPGLIVGPHDPTDRFTYWPSRVARGGRVLAPGRLDRQVQFIDVRDLAEWLLHLVQSGTTGLFNATGPDYLLTMVTLLDTCKQVCNESAEIAWADDTVLAEAGITPWSEMPLWIADSDEDHRYFASVDCRKAIACGLQFRPIEETIADTLAWDKTRAASEPRKAGLSAEKEAALTSSR